MFNLSGSELVVILLLALVILGPEKLPEAMRRFGRTYGELKKMGTGFQQEFKAAMEEPAREMRETADLLRTTVTDASSQVTGAVSATADKPVSPGGPTDVRAADDPPHPDPLQAEVPFAPEADAAASSNAAPIASSNESADSSPIASSHASADSSPIASSDAVTEANGRATS